MLFPSISCRGNRSSKKVHLCVKFRIIFIREMIHMWDIALLLLAGLGGLIIVGIVIGLSIWLFLRRSRQRLPDNIILEIDLETDLIEYVPNDRAAKTLLGGRPSLRDIVDALERAGKDDRVTGIIAHIGAARIGMAQIQELRDAILDFRAKKKFAIIFAETFGESGSGTGSYYLATAFDQIWLQPSGDLGLTGLIIENYFLRGTLDMLEITPRMDQRYEYKNAMNIYTEKQFTAPHRESYEKLLNSWFSQMVSAIAEARRMTQEQVRSLIDHSPLLAKEALEAGLVDGLAYRDEIYDAAKKRAKEGAQLLYLSRYMERSIRPRKKGKAIALIYGVGRVMKGKSGYDFLFNDARMGSETVAAAFRSAIDDKSVKAILFRIDSPGGSYVASDTIWREVVRAKKAGKSVIASMGNLAGSGGYFVAMSADKIVAQPGTITGSIGILSGKMLTSRFWEKLGVTWDEVHAGQNATIWTGTKDYTPTEWERFQAGLDRAYEDFTNKVAEGRGLSKEHVLGIAKGRIWTGEDAKNIGLVDELGGFKLALNLAKKAAAIPDDEEVRVKVFPARKSRLQILLKGKPDNSERDQTMELLSQILQLISPVARQLKVLRSKQENSVLMMPEDLK
jgi:protease IV